MEVTHSCLISWRCLQLTKIQLRVDIPKWIVSNMYSMSASKQSLKKSTTRELISCIRELKNVRHNKVHTKMPTSFLCKTVWVTSITPEIAQKEIRGISLGQILEVHRANRPTMSSSCRAWPPKMKLKEVGMVHNKTTNQTKEDQETTQITTKIRMRVV